MIKKTHVRGVLTPSKPNLVTDSTYGKMRDGLFDTGLARIMNNGEINAKGVIEFGYSYASGLGPNLTEVIRKLKDFLRIKEVKALNLYGKITLVMDTDDDFPKLYKLIVENGEITTKEGSISWKESKK